MRVLQFDRQVILPIVTHVASVIGKSDKPIMEHIHCKVEDDMLFLTGTSESLQMQSSIIIDPTLETENTAFTLPAKKFLDICRLGQGDKIKLTFEDDSAIAKVQCGRNRATLSGFDEKSFPTLEFKESPTKFEISAKTFLESINATDFSMAKNDARYFLNGINLTFKKANSTLVAVATDGHRLAFNEVKLDNAQLEDVSIILPAATVAKLKALLKLEKGNVIITIGDLAKNIRFEFSDYQMISKLIDGRFPDYNRVMPNVIVMRFSANRDELKGLIQRIIAFSGSNDKLLGGRFKFENNELTVSSHIRQSADNSEEMMAVKSLLEESEIELGINLSYLLDVLSHIQTENVVLGFQNANSALLVEPQYDDEQTAHSRYVIMPMRL